MRRMAKSFFWIDQQVIRDGCWAKLSPGAKLAYVALVAAADRQGCVAWGRGKLMALAGAADAAEFDGCLEELMRLSLIGLPTDGATGEVRVLSLDGVADVARSARSTLGAVVVSPAASVTVAGKSVVICTQTTVRIGGTEC